MGGQSAAEMSDSLGDRDRAGSQMVLAERWRRQESCGDWAVWLSGRKGPGEGAGTAVRRNSEGQPGLGGYWLWVSIRPKETWPVSRLALELKWNSVQGM